MNPESQKVLRDADGAAAPEPDFVDVLTQLGKLTSLRDTKLVEHSLLRSLSSTLGCQQISLYAAREENPLERAVHYKNAAGTEQIEEVTHGEMARPQVQALIEQAQKLGAAAWQGSEGHFIICQPIFANGKSNGYLVFERAQLVAPLEQAAMAGMLEIFSNYRDLLDTSQRDRLTGLLNRYSLELNLDHLWNLLSARLHEVETPNLRRHVSPHHYWIGVIDVDHFKNINDTYGHLMGDEVLITMTRILKKSFRASDLLYRYGGEEFIAVIAAEDLQSAMQVFERARAAVAAHAFPQVGQVTISTGFCSADPSVLPQEVINRADLALYKAKHGGRNQVQHYATLVEQGTLQKLNTGTVDLWN